MAMILRHLGAVADDAAARQRAGDELEGEEGLVVAVLPAQAEARPGDETEARVVRRVADDNDCAVSGGCQTREALAHQGAADAGALPARRDGHRGEADDAG